MKALVRFTFFCTAALVLGLAAEAGAGVNNVVINFDTDPNSNPIPNETDISNTYVPWGVVFSRTMLNTCETASGVFASSNCLDDMIGDPSTPPNIVTLCGPGWCSDISEGSHGLVIAHLLSDAIYVCIDFFPADEFDQGVFRAYDAANNEIEQQISPAGQNHTFCVNALGIRRVEFSGSGDGYGWFDTMRIGFDVVPTVPTTFSAIKAMYR